MSEPARPAHADVAVTGAVMEQLEGRLLLSSSAIDFIDNTADQFHVTRDVYTDADAAGNAFAARGLLSGAGSAPSTMDESFARRKHRGATSIRAEFPSNGNDWSGWYFLNGTLRADQTQPTANWGDVPNAGVDLTGAKTLTFWARGHQGGERVEFFAQGVGWDNSEPSQPAEPFPDSDAKVSLNVTLTTRWTRYKIDLRGQDLSSVLGGFGWVASAATNGIGSSNPRTITFYLDDIQYDLPRLDEPRFLVSYPNMSGNGTFEQVNRNVAFLYDNTMAMLADISVGRRNRARFIGDAIVYAQDHDRFYTDGRVRNAYQGGDLSLPAGWTPNGKVGTVRMPGRFDGVARQWYEDKFAVSTHTGNVAWAMIALLRYHQRWNRPAFLLAAQRLGDWIEANVRSDSGPGGYMGGFDGWEPTPSLLSYKSSEHNIDLYTAFGLLHGLTGKSKWAFRAEHAREFVEAMWDGSQKKFWIGTTSDGVTINRDVIPVDVQAWGVLSLGTQFGPALDFAAAHLKVGHGFDFNQDRDGVWNEGTAQVALAYRATNRQRARTALVDWLDTQRTPSGALNAAGIDDLTTGLDWRYFKREHVGATAWFVLASGNYNPL